MRTWCGPGCGSGNIHRFADRQIADRGLNEALLGSHSAGLAFAGRRRAHGRALEELVARARNAGALRPGVAVEDVRVGLRAIASFRGPPAAVRKLTDLLLTGLSS